MKIRRHKDGWWIEDTPDGVASMGPYSTKAEASAEKRGVQRFLDNENKRTFFTTEKR
jgi:hypothetical protein